MRCDVVAVGTELLLGQIVDTNSSHLAARLWDLSITTRWMTSCNDVKTSVEQGYPEVQILFDQQRAAALEDVLAHRKPQHPGLLPWRTVRSNARLLLDVKS